MQYVDYKIHISLKGRLEKRAVQVKKDFRCLLKKQPLSQLCQYAVTTVTKACHKCDNGSVFSNPLHCHFVRSFRGGIYRRKRDSAVQSVGMVLNAE